MSKFKIIYTKTDEAPALATYSLLPIVQAFADAADVALETADISLAGRILAQFPDHLTAAQRAPDVLAQLGALCLEPEANIIKLPNISASVPQLKAAIKELQDKGFNLPNYPDNAQTEQEKDARDRYAKVLGSAVNPVLRQGNSDRRAPLSVKNYARKNPHSMGRWTSDSKAEVAHMHGQGDFFANEKSFTTDVATSVRIEFVDQSGSVKVLKDKLSLKQGEVLDATFMSKKALSAFFAKEIKDAKDKGILWSLHIKATMMKISDPIIFGHAVRAYYGQLFEDQAALLQQIGFNPNNGMGNLYDKLEQLTADQRSAIETSIKACYANGPALAMVNSDKGITNLHVPSDVIVDASMPAMIRASGKMWGADGELYDVKAVIPDSTYAVIYEEAVNFCKKHGAFDPTTMGSVANVGLMAQKAEEYGSHDKTFEMSANGRMRVVDEAGRVLIEHQVEAGDIWRACQTKDAAIADWVRLAVSRARASGTPAVFWLDRARAHDAQLIKKVERYLKDQDTSGLDIRILPPLEAIRFSMERIIKGEDTISVTGNVLRDYLTDLFPILEVGTSAKMLSVVPLMAGGGLFETGAGGSAPKHVQQFLEENYLRWDSLGEFLALAVSLEMLGEKGNRRAALLGRMLDQATGLLLENDKSPQRRLGQLDNRGSHFYIALYWAQKLAAQNEDAELAQRFAPLAKALGENEQKIVDELKAVQGKPVDIGGYYAPDDERASRAMRPSATFNALLTSLV